MEISPAEKLIIEELRNLKPFEQVIITADKEGKPNRFLINFQRKVIISVDTSFGVK